MRAMKTKTQSRASRAKQRVAKEARAPYTATSNSIAALDLATLDQAAQKIGKTTHNIRDYIQRGRIAKYDPDGKRITSARNGELRVSLNELRAFLSLVAQGNEKHHHAGLHPELGFYNVPEHERTKHVHRLHPYLGKFIPQLVEWFLTRYFNADDVILDPFMGSGTTLVQGNELKSHTLGIDISEFNCRIARVKTNRYDVEKARREILDAERRVTRFSKSLTHAPDANPDFSGAKMEKLKASLLAECASDYLKTWFAPRALLEMLYYRRLIGQYEYQDLLRVVLSRAVRSSRLVPHYDLATPKEPLPVGKEYWCRKHSRMCTPIAECLAKIHAYSEDTARRLEKFNQLRSDKSIAIIQGDARVVDLKQALQNTPIANRLIDGIFTSPPYVGQIDYHDQHIYAYELFGIPRNDPLEIGPKRSGKSRAAQQKYIADIAAVFRNVLPALRDDAKIFIVANDRFKLYPEIARQSGMRIIEEFHRAVTKRTEQGDNPYQETIFLMMKENNAALKTAGQ
jgi:DNA modification methylase